MTDLSTRVGSRIRSFRKARGISIVRLSELTGKSQATLYKYESGHISPDVETLSCIAENLDIEPVFFFDIPRITNNTVFTVPYLDSGRLYAYYFDGRIQSMVKSLLVYYREPKDGAWRSVFYMNLKDFNEPESSRDLYNGTPIFHETVSFFVMENQTLPIETLVIELVHPMHNSQSTWGLFMGLSDEPVAPMATKILFSRVPLSENELSSYSLIFTKEQLKTIRKNNAILLTIRDRENIDI